MKNLILALVILALAMLAPLAAADDVWPCFVGYDCSPPPTTAELGDMGRCGVAVILQKNSLQLAYCDSGTFSVTQYGQPGGGTQYLFVWTFHGCDPQPEPEPQFAYSFTCGGEESGIAGAREAGVVVLLEHFSLAGGTPDINPPADFSGGGSPAVLPPLNASTPPRWQSPTWEPSPDFVLRASGEAEWDAKQLVRAPLTQPLTVPSTLDPSVPTCWRGCYSRAAVAEQAWALGTGPVVVPPSEAGDNDDEGVPPYAPGAVQGGDNDGISPLPGAAKGSSAGDVAGPVPLGATFVPTEVSDGEVALQTWVLFPGSGLAWMLVGGSWLAVDELPDGPSNVTVGTCSVWAVPHDVDGDGVPDEMALQTVDVSFEGGWAPAAAAYKAEILSLLGSGAVYLKKGDCD